MAEDEKISQPGEDAQAPSPKRKAKRGWIIGGVVAAVIVVAGAGFWVWHETPSFCNAICHSPMDSYVDTYYSGDLGSLAQPAGRAGHLAGARVYRLLAGGDGVAVAATGQRAHGGGADGSDARALEEGAAVESVMLLSGPAIPRACSVCGTGCT